MRSRPTGVATSNSIVPAQSVALVPKRFAQATHTHLQFRLGTQPALLPTHQVQEVMTIATASVSPMPNMPPALLGLINRRSQVLWVTDLALLLGLPIAYPNTQQYNLVLMQVNTVLLGLRVHQIDGILSVPPERLQPASNHLPNSVMPFLRGCLFQANEVHLVLDAEAILRAPALQVT